jgi:menaquinone-dependent protoporphyrinogen IX oxidase
MSKKVLIISTSPRKGSNSEALAEAFAAGARDKGHEVELVSLRDKDIRFCRGCFACQKTRRCVIRDDADRIEQKMEKADVLVFATPIYYYEMSGQMKTMLDRGNPLYTTDYAFRDVYLLTSAAEEEDSVWQRAKNGLEGWIECFPKARLAGCAFAGGVTETGEAGKHPAMEKAYELGAQV